MEKEDLYEIIQDLANAWLSAVNSEGIYFINKEEAEALIAILHGLSDEGKLSLDDVLNSEFFK